MTHAPFDTARFVMDYRSRFPTPVSPDALETQREAGEGETRDYADELCPCNNDMFGEGPCSDCRKDNEALEGYCCPECGDHGCFCLRDVA